MEQLDAGNIKSVSIKKLLIRGELAKEVSIPLPGEKNAVKVKYFQTDLPAFQGDGLLPQLRGKNVIITIESAEQGFIWQLLIGILPWVLINLAAAKDEKTAMRFSRAHMSGILKERAYLISKGEIYEYKSGIVD